MVFLGSTTALTWYAGRSNAKIAAYLIVFHEKYFGWESRLKELKMSPFDWFNLNRMVFLIYFGLGVLSFIIPWTIRCNQIIETWHKVLLFVIGAWFVFDLILLVWGYPRQSYKEKWILIEKKELHKG